VVSYREKYTDYKNKVKQANVQIQKLMHTVAKYEMAGNDHGDESEN
jgi:hypothetical protein